LRQILEYLLRQSKWKDQKILGAASMLRASERQLFQQYVWIIFSCKCFSGLTGNEKTRPAWQAASM